jgi:flagellar biosynthesis/type III secretory pathway chaperone
MNPSPTETTWEDNLTQLLEDLTWVQDELLDVLARKRLCMARGDRQAMAELQPIEQSLCERLQQCHERRCQLLRDAAEEGYPSENLVGLAGQVKQRGGGDLRKQVKKTASRMSLLQQNCLANWVLAQKALLHASQMLEIIASGGRLQPTYGNRADHTVGGALVDQEA